MKLSTLAALVFLANFGKDPVPITTGRDILSDQIDAVRAVWQNGASISFFRSKARDIFYICLDVPLNECVEEPFCALNSITTYAAMLKFVEIAITWVCFKLLN